jgi:hypothetical protein
MKVKVLRPFWYEGKVKAAGTEVDLPEALGREVVFVGKAERAAEKPPAKPEAKPEETKPPMTTKSAKSLLGGKHGD